MSSKLGLRNKLASLVSTLIYSQSALGSRDNYCPIRLIPRGGLCPAVGRMQAEMIMK